jgi:predicted esterase
MNRGLSTLGIAIIVLTIPAPRDLSAAPPGKSKIEKSILGKIATEWINLGRWCAGRNLAEEAKRCASRAESASPEAKGLADLKEKAEACKGEAAEADRKTCKRKLDSASNKVARHYEKLFGLAAKAADASDRERLEGYLWIALDISPSDKRWGSVLSIVTRLVGGKEAEKGLRLANRALALGPPKKFVPKFRSAVDRAATDKLVLMTASVHPLRYYFSLPKSFRRQKGRKWPVLVCVDGAGSNFEGIARNYKNKRGDLPFLIVSPCSFSNTNQIQGNMLKKYKKYYSDEVIEEGNRGRIRWDEEGVLTVLKDLRENFDAQERIYVTGFSGGGNITYMMIFRHPDMLNGAAPACANFSGKGAWKKWKEEWKFSDEDVNFPLHIITGANDKHRDFTHGNKNSPGIEPQTNWAEECLKELGYPNTKRTMVPGMGHSAAQKHVIDTFRPYWEGKKKRADKLG